MKRVLTEAGVADLPHLVLPTALRVDRYRYPVAVVRGLRRQSLLGLLRFNNRCRGIIVEADQSEIAREETLVHEVIHAIWPDHLHRVDGIARRKIHEEDYVHALDHRLARVLRHNNLPRMFGELHGAAKALGVKR